LVGVTVFISFQCSETVHWVDVELWTSHMMKIKSQPANQHSYVTSLLKRPVKMSKLCLLNWT